MGASLFWEKPSKYLSKTKLIFGQKGNFLTSIVFCWSAILKLSFIMGIIFTPWPYIVKTKTIAF